jgi:Icc-related predicted phosphoesterase
VFGRKRKDGRTRLFFATDIHGSDQCFRKWVNAAAVYEVQALILGGDVTGKVVVPLVAAGDGTWQGELHGEPVVAQGEDELEALQKRIRTMGRYDVVMTAGQKAELDSDPALLDGLFHQAMRESLERWRALAEERLAEAGIPSFMMLGNDDFDDLADTIRGSEVVTYAEDGIFELPGGYELASVGYSTPTPWNTPRELSEEDLAARIEDVVGRLKDPRHAVFNFHCPPRDTHLDQAPLLSADLRPVVDASGMRMTSVGSTAVRRAIEESEPLLGLHGHVHESPAGQKLGTTVCINPGSDYGDGILRGAIVDLDREQGVARWQIVQG